MADTPNFDSLKHSADEIYARYTANFAGKPRATRELGILEDLITQLDALIEQTKTLMNGDRDATIVDFLETATSNLERYHSERSAIREAKAQPHAVEGALLAARANRCFDVYGRHFAGQNRGTRDRMLLHEVVNELEDLRVQMRNLLDRGGDKIRGDLETVSQQLQMYRDEVTNIARAQTVGTQEEVANRLAELANAQFKLYQAHFAGKSRTTRRPALIERMIANLEEYQAEMNELAEDGFTSTMNRNNIGIIANNLEMYRNELKAIRDAREQTAVADLAGALGGAANEVFAAYQDNFAGKERATRDLDLMSTICDQLREIALQMREIGDEISIDSNDKNLHIVEERWATYEGEFRRIQEAKGIA